MRLLAAILWDTTRGVLGLAPYHIPMVGASGQVAVVSSVEAQRHIAMLSGGTASTTWRNTVAPRALLSMMRYRPADDAARCAMPLLVCVATLDRETPEETARPLAERAPRGRLARFAATHFDFYTDPATRDQALADQIAFLQARR